MSKRWYFIASSKDPVRGEYIGLELKATGHGHYKFVAAMDGYETEAKLIISDLDTNPKELLTNAVSLRQLADALEEIARGKSHEAEE